MPSLMKNIGQLNVAARESRDFFLQSGRVHEYLQCSEYTYETSIYWHPLSLVTSLPSRGATSAT